MTYIVIQNEPCEPLGVFEDVLLTRRLDYRYARLFEEEAPRDLKGCRGLIVMGGPMNVYEEKRYPFLKDEDRLIKEALKKEVPVLGVCLGAQLIAKAAGAKVWKGEKKEIGWHKVRLTGEANRDRLFNMFGDELLVFQWHGDTFELPRGAILLAENELYLQAFRLKNAYALQFHLEVTGEMIRDWLEEYEDVVRSLGDAIDPNKIRVETDGNIESLNSFAKEFFKKWLAL